MLCTTQSPTFGKLLILRGVPFENRRYIESGWKVETSFLQRRPDRGEGKHVVRGVSLRQLLGGNKSEARDRNRYLILAAPPDQSGVCQRSLHQITIKAPEGLCATIHLGWSRNRQSPNWETRGWKFCSVLRQRQGFSQPFRSLCKMTRIVAPCWTTWTARNRFLLWTSNEVPTVYRAIVNWIGCEQTAHHWGNTWRYV